MSIQKAPTKNKILFDWLNQYAGILLITPSKTIAIDPVDVNAKKLQNVDTILITHEYYDHLDPPASCEPQMEFAKLLKKELYRTACLIPEQNKIYQVSKKEVEA